MFSKDLKTETTTAALVSSAAIAATASQTGVDISDYAGNLLVVANIGAATAGTNPTMNVKIETSDSSGSGYSDVSGAAFTEVTTVAGVQTMSLETRGLKKYIRTTTTLGGTSSPSFPVSVTFTGYKKQV